MLLGVTNSLIDDDVSKKLLIIIAAWLGFYLVVEIILEIIKCARPKSTCNGKVVYISKNDALTPENFGSSTVSKVESG